MTEQSGAKSAAEDLSAAWDEMEKADEVVSKAPEGDAEEVEAPARDEKGRFRAKDEEGTPDPGKPVDVPQEPKDELKAEPKDEPETTSYRPPPGWSVAAKAAFDALPDPVKAAIAKREDEVSSGFKQKSEQIGRYEPIEQIIAPWRGRWQMEGQTEAQAISRLLSIQSAIEQNPAQGIAWLAQQYGVSLNNTPQAPSQQGQGGQSADPRLNAVMRELQTLRQSMMSQQQAQTAAQEAAVLAEIDAFKADPKHKWFGNVEAEMAGLIRSGAAKSLKDAYDKACWLNDEVRAQLISEQRAAQSATQRQTAQQAAQKAKAAAVSLTGAPGGASPPKDAPPKSIRAALEQAWDAPT